MELRLTKKFPRTKKRSIGLISVSAFALLLGSAYAGTAWADGPAVSTVNEKISVEGGDLGGHGAGIAQGSITFPVTHSFGAQFDFAAGDGHGYGLWGAGAQGFWRDPTAGLAGLFVTHSDHGDAPPARKPLSGAGVYVNRYGIEGEQYFGRFTPGVAAGYQDGIFLDKKGGFAVLDLGWYPVDNFNLSGGGDLNSAHSRVLLGAEYQLGLIPALPGLTAFTEAALSGQRDSYALVGFRIYFGPNKTLMRRQREDDPGATIIDTMSNTYSPAPTPTNIHGPG